MDWALIETWKEMEIPLHVALRGIEKAFDSWESKPRKRGIKSLLYCQEEVEAQFAEWREARVGAGEPEEQGQNGEQPRRGGEGLFTRAAILEHLKRGRISLVATCERRMKAGERETSLTGVERMLSDSVRSVVGAEELATIEREVKEQLKPYRRHMEPTVYQQTVDNLLLKRLREQFGVPRLSLFYL